MRLDRVYEPVTIGAVLFLLLKLLVATAHLAGAYYSLPLRSVSGLGDVKVELMELKSETERKETKRVTTKRSETLEYTLNFEPSYEWNNAIDPQHRVQLNKAIQEGIETTAEQHLKRKITIQTPTKQTTQIELDPGQADTWELEVKQEVVIGRVLVGQNKNEQISIPFRLVVAKSFEARPIKAWWQVWK